MQSEAWTETRINQMIADGIEESLHLDYKAAGALAKRPEKKCEIVKDVTAFANSDGGVIIYGVREHASASQKHLPSHIDPIRRTEISKEWLEHVIANAAPRIAGVKINPIPNQGNSETCLYAVEIPRGETAHQCTDGRYYRRYNFESVIMADHEIRDVMNRVKSPLMKIQIYVGIRDSWETSSFLIRAKNVSRVIAKQFAFEVKLPIGIDRRLVSVENAILETDGDGHFLQFSMGQDLKSTPLFPFGERIFERELKTGIREWRCKSSGNLLTPSKVICVEVFADEMQPYRAIFDPGTSIHNWRDPDSIEILG